MKRSRACLKGTLVLLLSLLLVACATYQQPSEDAPGSVTLVVDDQINGETITREGKKYRAEHQQDDYGFIPDSAAKVVALKVNMYMNFGLNAGILTVDGEYISPWQNIVKPQG